MTTDNQIAFLKVAAICSILGALTTVLLIFLPNPAADDFESQTQLFNNSLYLTKLWILFIHPQLNIIASLGIAFIFFKKYPLQIILGTFFLFIWAFSEMSQQALLIDTLNQIWRPGFIGADTTASKNMFETLIKAANGISDSKYFLVIYGFGMGSLFYGWAFLKEQGMPRWIGGALLFIGVLSLTSFSSYYLNMDFFSSWVNWIYQWIYPYLQPLVRIAIGLWIYLEVKKRIANINT